MVAPGNEGRSDLPKLQREEKPVGYRAGLQIEERLQGVGAIVLGVIGLTVSWLIFSGALPVGLPPPPPPPGVLVQVPVMNPTQCIAPIMGLGGISLILVGFRRTLDP